MRKKFDIILFFGVIPNVDADFKMASIVVFHSVEILSFASIGIASQIYLCLQSPPGNLVDFVLLLDRVPVFISGSD